MKRVVLSLDAELVERFEAAATPFGLSAKQLMALALAEASKRSLGVEIPFPEKNGPFKVAPLPGHVGDVRKTNAIKAVRQYASLSLKDAIDVVEGVRRLSVLDRGVVAVLKDNLAACGFALEEA